MKQLRYALSVFVSAFLSGIMISIGGTVYLKLAADGTAFGKVAGAFLFSIGLYTILAFGLHLYTGKIGYVFLPGNSYPFKLSELLMTLIGNFAGTQAFGALFTKHLVEKTAVVSLIEGKLNMSLGLVFLQAVGCGILMFVAVFGYKTVPNDVTKIILVLFGVSGFILAGFEHSIADMFYVAAAGMLNGKTLLMLLVIVLGNTVGGAGFGYLSQSFGKLIKKS